MDTVLTEAQVRLFSRLVNRAFRSNAAIDKLIAFVETTGGKFGESDDGLLTVAWPKPQYNATVQKFVRVLVRHKLGTPRRGGFVEFNIETDPAAQLDNLLTEIGVFNAESADAAEELV